MAAIDSYIERRKKQHQQDQKKQQSQYEAYRQLGLDSVIGSPEQANREQWLEEQENKRQMAALEQSVLTQTGGVVPDLTGGIGGMNAPLVMSKGPKQTVSTPLDTYRRELDSIGSGLTSMTMTKPSTALAYTPVTSAESNRAIQVFQPIDDFYRNYMGRNIVGDGDKQLQSVLDQLKLLSQTGTTAERELARDYEALFQVGRNKNAGDKIAGTVATFTSGIGAGLSTYVPELAGGLSAAIGDADTRGGYSSGFKALDQYFALHPDTLSSVQSGKPVWTESIKAETGVSDQVLRSYLQSTSAEATQRDQLASMQGTYGLSDKWAEGVYSQGFQLGRQIPGLAMSTGAAGGGDGGLLGTIMSGGTLGTAAKTALQGNLATYLIGTISAAGSYAKNIREHDYSVANYANALAQGFIEYFTEGLFGFSDMPSFERALTNPVGGTASRIFKALIAYLESGLEEGAEEVVNVPLSAIVDRLTGYSSGNIDRWLADPRVYTEEVTGAKALFDEGGIFDINEMWKSGVSGAIGGLLMGSAATVVAAAQSVAEGADIREAVQAINREAYKALPEQYRPQPLMPNTVRREDILPYRNQVLDAIRRYRDNVVILQQNGQRIDVTGIDITPTQNTSQGNTEAAKPMPVLNLVPTESGASVESVTNNTIEDAMFQYGDQLSKEAKLIAAEAWKNYQDLHPNTRVTAQQFVNEFTQAYTYGRGGATLETAKAGYTGELLTDATLEAAYKAGVEASQQTEELETPAEAGEVNTDIQSVLADEEYRTLPQDVRKSIVSAYAELQDMDASEYAADAARAYESGRAGLKLSDMIGQTLSGVQARDLQTYYDAGVTAGKESQAKGAATRAELRRRQIAGGNVGHVVSISEDEARHYGVKTVSTANMSAKQKASIAAIRRLAKMFNFNVVLYESPTDSSGKHIGDNGFYVNGTATVYVDVESGDTGEQAILRTMAHELTHHLELSAPSQYNELRDFLLDFYRSNGTLEELISREHQLARQNGRTISEAEAVHEVVANGCEMMLTDTEAIQRIANEHRNLAQRIFARIREYLRAIRDAIKNMNPSSQAAIELRSAEGVFQKASKLWHDALAASAEAEAEENTKADPARPDMSNSEAFRDSEVAIQSQVRPIYSDGTKAFQEFADSLSEDARKTFDLFYNFYQLSRISNTTNAQGKHVSKINISSPFLTAQEWNAKINSDQKWRNTAVKLAASLPPSVRKAMYFNLDGTLTATPLELEFKMAKSLAQRLVDSLPLEVIDSTYQVGDKTIKLYDQMSRQSVGGEAYRRAVTNEVRKLYEAGRLKQVSIGAMTKDRWGSLGFLATNGKTTASGDLTTLCPQMMYNRGCFYCYRRAAMESGVNNKLVAERVWYTGDILRIKDADIQALNENGGLRIQSFGDWMPQFSAQLADILYDADTRGLQVKIITKEPTMIQYVASLKDQGIGKSVYFNLSADYAFEQAPENMKNQNDPNDLNKINPIRPFYRDDDNTLWWKRAMTVEEANEYRKKYNWVNTRIVATDIAEFVRGLKDPTVDVVTGYHGHIRNWYRIDTESGERKSMVEPLGDAGMPRFEYNEDTRTWNLEYEGKTKTHKALAQAIIDNNLQWQYYYKTCCITGRCATCKGHCGLMAQEFGIKNYTNRDAESVAYWQENAIQLGTDPGDLIVPTVPEWPVQRSARPTVKESEQELPKLKTLGGSNIQRSKYGVGKQMGNQIYVHKDYADEIVPADVWDKAQKIIDDYGFQYNTIMYDTSKPTEVRFDEAPDFDTAREPIPGTMMKVDTDTGTVSKAKGNGNMIWHHKWQWVHNDYDGFDVMESYNWSKRWLQDITNPSGSLRVWNQALREHGLPIDKDETIQHSMRVVEPIESTSDKWARGHSEAWFRQNGYPVREDVSEEWLNARMKKGWYEGRKPISEKHFDKVKEGTQITGTLATYKNIYNHLEKWLADNGISKENFRILDASSGMGLGTEEGLKRGFNVTDIEPYVSPDSTYMPDYMDYTSLQSQVENGDIEPFDFVISNAVLNVIPQDTRDNMVKWFDSVLKPGGWLYVNTLPATYGAIKNAKPEITYDENGEPTGSVLTQRGENGAGNEVFVWGSSSVQKGFSPSELKAYLSDGLPGYNVDTPVDNPKSKKDPMLKYKVASGSVMAQKPEADVQHSSRRSAQAKRDSGDKLTEYEFYSLYSAHKLNLRKLNNIQEQIESIRTEGFKGYGGFSGNLMPTRQYVSYRGVNQYNELLKMEQNGDLPEGFAENFRNKLGEEYGKPVPGNVVEAKYGPRKGEYILLVPKSGAEINKYVDRVKPGFKPAFDWEIVQADYDFQPYYEMYSKAYDAANADVQSSSRTTLPESGKTVNQLNRRIESLEHQLEQAKHRLTWVKSDAYLAGAIEQGKAMAKEIRAAKAAGEKAVAKATAAGQRTVASRDREIANLNERIDRLNDVLRETRERRDEQLKELRAHYTEKMVDYKESQARQHYRDRVFKRANELLDWVTRPTKDHYVPEILKQPVVELLGVIDMSSKRYLNGGEDTKADLRLAQKLQALNRIVGNMAEESAADSMMGMYDLYPEFQAQLAELVQKATDANAEGNFYTVNTMSSEELRALNNILRELKHTILTSNKVFANNMYARMDELSKDGMEDYKEMGKKNQRGDVASFFGNFLAWRNTLPVFAFDRLGRAGKALFEGFKSGQSKLAFNLKQVVDFTESVVNEEQVKAWDNEKHTIQRNGESYDVSAWQLIELLEIYNRSVDLIEKDGGTSHLFGGGVTFSDNKWRKNDQGGVMTLEEVLAAIGQLSEEQTEVARKLQEYISKTGGAWGNQISMARYGSRAFTEEHYWPFRSDSNHLYTSAKDVAGNSINRLLNASFTKPLTRRANNRVIIGNAMNTFSAHMSDMAQYNAFALPVLDIVRFLNYRESVDYGDGRVDTYTMRNALTEAFGKAKDSIKGLASDGDGQSVAVAYLQHLLDDINGQQKSGRSTGIDEISHTNMKRAAVAANLRVALLQPTAIMRASLLLGPGTLAKAVAKPWNTKADIAEMLEHSGIALWKDMGFYEVNASRSMQHMIAHDDTALEKAIEKSMGLAEFMDKVTWAAIWRACKIDVAKTGEYKSGSPEFFDAVTAKFEDVIYRTQVVDSVLTKSDVMRNKHLGDRIASQFMSEPSTTYNMLASTALSYADDVRRYGKGEAWKRNKNRVLRSLATFITTAALTSVAEALVDAYRDDDEFEDFFEKFRKEYPSALLENLNPLGLLPYASQFNDVIKRIIHPFNKNVYGFKPYQGTFDWADDLVSGAEILAAKVSGKTNNYTTYGMVYKALSAISQASGIPFAAATREAIALWNSTVGKFNPDMVARTYDPGIEKRIQYAYQDGSISKEEAVELLTSRANLSTDEAVKKMQGWRRIEIRGELTADNMDDTVQALVEEGGMSERDAYFDVQKREYEATTGLTYSKYNAVNDAVLYGDDEGYRLAMKELTEHGYEQKAVESAVRDFLRHVYTGQDLTQAESDIANGRSITAAEAVRLLTKYGGLDENEALWRIDEWDAEAESGDKDSWRQYDEFFTAVETGKNLKQTVQKYLDRGVEGSTLTRQITTQFKPIYLDLYDKGKASSLIGYLINAYVLCDTSDATDKEKEKKAKDKINNWVKERDKEESAQDKLNRILGRGA